MHDDELHRFKSDIPFIQYATERYGYQRDRRESSVSSHVLRQPATDDKIVVRKDRDGHWTYFSVRDDRDHGTILDFVLWRGGHRSLGSVREELRAWLGISRPALDLARLVPQPPTRDVRPVAEVFAAARRVDTCVYLSARGLRSETLGHPRFAGTWALDARGRVLFVHRDEAGAVTGFEIKSRGFTGFATGGTKSAWQSTEGDADRAIVITESAIDALSYHQIHRDRGDDARYLSTAGTPGRRQLEVLERLCARMPRASTVVAAVDADEAGRKLAERIEALTGRLPHLDFRRDAPAQAKDWNDVLQQIERDVPRACRSPEHAR